MWSFRKFLSESVNLHDADNIEKHILEVGKSGKFANVMILADFLDEEGHPRNHAKRI